MNDRDTLTSAADFAEGDFLQVYGARAHNLKNIDVSLPRNKLVVITGVSGSGKSSLAFDTIYAEGQRRYIESFSSYARQFLGSLERPDVDKITGLSPVISIEQKTTSRNPRSTVGTVTEVYDFIRLLYARIGEAFSYVTGKKMVRFTDQQIQQYLFEKFRGKHIALLAPVVRGRKGHYRELFEKIRFQGYLKVRVDGEIMDVRERMQVDRYKMHDIEVVVDRLRVEEKFTDRLRNSLQAALKLGNDLCMVMDYDNGEIFYFSKKLMCPDSGIAYEDPNPNTFSFNSPYGACPLCRGLGAIYEVNTELVIPDKTKSIHQGALVPLGEWRDNYAFRELRKLARKYQFTFSQPLSELSPEALQVILYGDNGTSHKEQKSWSDATYTQAFTGIVHMIKSCFHNSASENLRRWAEEFMDMVECPECKGSRLKKEALFFKVAGKNIAQLAQMSIAELAGWFGVAHPAAEQLEKFTVDEALNERQRIIAKDILKEIRMRLQFLLDVGLEYLTLNRPARSLSGGESQRIRLATQIGSQLRGITYILDEPSIGLHQRDNHRLIRALRELTDIGNTVIVVEHDKDIMLSSDYIVDLGPGAGHLGGHVVAAGPPKEFIRQGSVTAHYLSGEEKIAVPAIRRKGNGKILSLYGCTGHNLKHVNLKLPLGKMICVTGVSGSGKSSLVNETLYPILRSHLYGARQKALPYERIEGMDHIDSVIEVDQSPIGRSPRSNPATYIGVFSDIRSLFAQLPEAKIRGYKPGRFSFNVKGGRCEVCEGGGMKVIEMNFLPDVYVQCEKCLGKRYNRETLEVRYKGKSISDVLEMTIEEAVSFFENVPSIYRKVKTLYDVGLGYVTLGQPAPTLSGGEAQRVKLAAELCKKDTGNTLYILDEPTTGLHFQDIKMLLSVLNRLVDHGNTVLIIEHNLDVIKVADHIIDLGPEGGHRGGEVIATGTPEQIARNKKSHTGMFLIRELPY
ncbi:MAG: UvrABC system protein A [Chitinophagales bacterium]|nr:MAG: UvrABC system protein A [Chitinophagales bacterium]